MREIVLDTETTGLSARDGHRVVEIGCIELRNLAPTGKVYQAYICPERDMPVEAFNVHGLSEDFLAGQPTFDKIADDFLSFVAGGRLVIHNAQFDLGFLNAELARLDKPALTNDVVDTVALARKKFPGAQANLDALCRRFGIDNSAREKHGALLDAELLAEVYLELMGGRQPGLGLSARAGDEDAAQAQSTARPERSFSPSAAESTAHDAFVDKIDDPIWRK
jgi:DNA polymerase-3 subunit epsilon